MTRPSQLDVRGPRFGAAVTTAVLAVAFVTAGTAVSTVLLIVQALAFAIGALVGPHAQPYGVLFAKVIRPRLSPATEFEDAAPPRFAQAVGRHLACAVAAFLVDRIGGVHHAVAQGGQRAQLRLHRQQLPLLAGLFSIQKQY